MFYIGARSRPPNPTTLRRNPTPREAHPAHPRTQRLSPSQRPSRGARGTSESRHLLIPPGPVPPSLTTRRWKTPWTVLESLLAEQPCPMERNGAARSRGPLGSPSASSNKLGCRRLPAPGHRRPTGYPLLLRGELTLDFPLPALAYGGQRSQPCIGAYDG